MKKTLIIVLLFLLVSCSIKKDMDTYIKLRKNDEKEFYFAGETTFTVKYFDKEKKKVKEIWFYRDDLLDLYLKTTNTTYKYYCREILDWMKEERENKNKK